MWEVVKMCLAMEYVKSALVIDGSVGTTVMSHTVMVLQAKTRKPWEDKTSRLSIKLGEPFVRCLHPLGGIARAYMKDERAEKVRPNCG